MVLHSVKVVEIRAEEVEFEVFGDVNVILKGIWRRMNELYIIAENVRLSEGENKERRKFK